MSGSADIRVLFVRIFPIFSAWPRRSSATLLAIVVMIGLPFLNQLTAMAWKYIGTSKDSNIALISLCARSAFLHSASRMGGLNWRMRQCGLALGLFGVVGRCCCRLGAVFWVGLITVGLADLIQHVV